MYNSAFVAVSFKFVVSVLVAISVTISELTMFPETAVSILWIFVIVALDKFVVAFIALLILNVMIPSVSGFVVSILKAVMSWFIVITILPFASTGVFLSIPATLFPFWSYICILPFCPKILSNKALLIAIDL